MESSVFLGVPKDIFGSFLTCVIGLQMGAGSHQERSEVTSCLVSSH